MHRFVPVIVGGCVSLGDHDDPEPSQEGIALVYHFYRADLPHADSPGWSELQLSRPLRIGSFTQLASRQSHVILISMPKGMAINRVRVVCTLFQEMCCTSAI